MRNRYEMSEDEKYCKVFFRDGTWFTIDSEDLEAISARSWSKGKRGYPISHLSRKSLGGSKTVPLHRFLLPESVGGDIDHINGNKLDNRRCNLRICSHQQNMFNQKRRCTNTSGFAGVSFDKRVGRYEAYYNLNAKKHSLGFFETAELAAEARRNAVIEAYGEYAREYQEFLA